MHIWWKGRAAGRVGSTFRRVKYTVGSKKSYPWTTLLHCLSTITMGPFVGKPEGVSNAFLTYFDYFFRGIKINLGGGVERHQKGGYPPPPDKSSIEWDLHCLPAITVGPVLPAHHQVWTCTGMAAHSNGRSCTLLHKSPTQHHDWTCIALTHTVTFSLNIITCPPSQSDLHWISPPAHNHGRTCTAMPPFWTIIFLERNPATCHRSNVKFDADMLTSLRHAVPYKFTNCLLHNKTALT